METADLDKLARRNGFQSLAELRGLLLQLQMRSPADRRMYGEWAGRDGSRAGLLRLLEAADRQAPAAGEPRPDPD